MAHNANCMMKRTDVLIFKTSIQTPLEVRFLAPTLDNHQGVSAWSVDLEDWEKILRIESDGINPDEVKSILDNINIRCKQL
jgi:hypothetical protein